MTGPWTRELLTKLVFMPLSIDSCDIIRSTSAPTDVFTVTEPSSDNEQWHMTKIDSCREWTNACERHPRCLKVVDGVSMCAKVGDGLKNLALLFSSVLTDAVDELQTSSMAFKGVQAPSIVVQSISLNATNAIFLITSRATTFSRWSRANASVRSALKTSF